MVKLQGRIVIMPQDQLILVDGVAYETRLSGGFLMRNGEWAVHFNFNTGVGNIEYIDLNNESINEQVFNEAYGYWLPEVCQKALDYADDATLLPVQDGGE